MLKHHRILKERRTQKTLNFAAAGGGRDDLEDDSKNSLRGSSPRKGAKASEEKPSREIDSPRNLVPKKGGDLLDEISEKQLDQEIDRVTINQRYAKLKDMQELIDLKGYIRSKIGNPFSTNVLRIALNMKEVTIASTLVAFHKVDMD